MKWDYKEYKEHKHTHTYTHTHTHTGTYRQPWTSFFSRNFTPNRGHTLQSFRRSSWTFCVCVCVCVSSNYLTMDYPPTPTYVHVWNFFFFTCMPMRFATDWRFSDNQGRPWLVCVHSFIVIFLISVHRWRHLQRHTHTHTHTHTSEMLRKRDNTYIFTHHV